MEAPGGHGALGKSLNMLSRTMHSFGAALICKM